MENNSGNPVVIDNIPFEIDGELAIAKAGVSAGSHDEEEFRLLVKKVIESARPKALYTISYVKPVDAESVEIGGCLFKSSALCKNLEGTGRVFPYVVTCGREVGDACSGSGAIEKYRLDVLREMLLGAAYEHLKVHLENRYAIPAVSSMCPGSGDLDVWPIRQQKDLFALLGDTLRLVGVELTESCLMIPDKSVSGIFFPSEVDFQSCRLCRREKCPERKEPFDRHSADLHL